MIVTSYFDTSFLVKLYIQEADSAIAWRIVLQPGLRATISWLSEVEMATALSPRFANSGRGITAAQMDQANSAFRAQLSQGIYAMAPVDKGTFDLARSYGERYGGALGVRALDVLHVAAAMRHGAEAFGTFDTRQARLAKEVGLKVLA